MRRDQRDDNRLRGRAGVEQRKRRLQAEPLCRHCAAKGKVRIATAPDHIKPLALGGTDTDDNIQCLCADCHAIKTAIEDAAHSGAATHPDWLEPSAIPLTIICGPPCSGKTTYLTEHAKPYDITIDLDVIAATVRPGYVQWSGSLSDHELNKALRIRNAMLGSLERQTRGQAWFIVSAPTKAEREWWQDKLGGEIVLLNPGFDECKRRAVERGTPRAVKGVDDWERASRSPWTRKATRPPKPIGVDADGWPLGPGG